MACKPTLAVHRRDSTAAGRQTATSIVVRIRRNPAAWSRGEARRTSNAVTNEEAAICREEQSGADFGPDFLNELPLAA